MSAPDLALWVYLSRTPLLWLTVTLVVYVIADRASAATNRHPSPIRFCIQSGCWAFSCG